MQAPPFPDVDGTPRAISFCGHAILSNGTFVINDAQAGGLAGLAQSQAVAIVTQPLQPTGALS